MKFTAFTFFKGLYCAYVGLGFAAYFSDTMLVQWVFFGTAVIALLGMDFLRNYLERGSYRRLEYVVLITFIAVLIWNIHVDMTRFDHIAYGAMLIKSLGLATYVVSMLKIRNEDRSENQFSG